MIPTVGRIVLYTLTHGDAEEIEMRRAGPGNFRGTPAIGGQVFPMFIVAADGISEDQYVNGQVILDGNDTHWAVRVKVGDGPGSFAWPRIH